MATRTAVLFVRSYYQNHFDLCTVFAEKYDFQLTMQLVVFFVVEHFGLAGAECSVADFPKHAEWNLYKIIY